MTSATPRKLGLALGSGAARGMAHIGILNVLQQEDVPIHCISGTSIGALIGVLYAAGVAPERLASTAQDLDWKQLAGLLDPVLPTSGLIDGHKVRSFIRELLPVDHFEELKIPVAITATDIQSGEPLIIRQGNLLDALHAALAFPGIFTPVRFGDRYLMDGGLCNPVPTDVAQQLGADCVVGVCAIPRVEKPQEASLITPDGHLHQEDDTFFNARRIEKIFRDIWRSKGGGTAFRRPTLLRVAAKSIAIMENQINDLRLQITPPDLLLRPDLRDVTLLEFHRASEAIEAGEAEMRMLLPQLRQLLEGN